MSDIRSIIDENQKTYGRTILGKSDQADEALIAALESHTAQAVQEARIDALEQVITGNRVWLNLNTDIRACLMTLTGFDKQKVHQLLNAKRNSILKEYRHKLNQHKGGVQTEPPLELNQPLATLSNTNQEATDEPL
jgi:hypothetical protein